MTSRVLLAGCLLLATAGCGAAADPPSGGSGPATSTTSFTEEVTVTPTAPGRGRVVTVRGTVSDGVEPGCLLLAEGEGDGLWLLVGRTSGLAAGDTVTLRGTVMNGTATTCQQGRPLRVDEVLAR